MLFSLLPVILGVAVVVVLLGCVSSFCNWFFEIFSGPNPTEELYNWAVASLDNGDGQLLSLEQIENMPYKAEALKTAFSNELYSVDNYLYIMELTDSTGAARHAEYNLKALTSNYGLPWQVQMAVCTANQYSSMDDFMEQNAEKSDTQANGFKYYVTENEINAVSDYMATSIEYVTNYAKYGLIVNGQLEEGVYDGSITYDELAANPITDMSDTDGKYACIYKEENGVGCYYPVAALKHVSTWLWDYDFDYDIVLDDQGRPTDYLLKSVVKTSHIGGTDGLLADLANMGIDGTLVDLFYYIADMMPYAQENGYVNGMKGAVNYYKETGTEWQTVIDGYDSSLAYKVVSPVYLENDMSRVHNEAAEAHGTLEITDSEQQLVSWNFDPYSAITLEERSLWSREETVEYAMKYLGKVFYNAEYKGDDGAITGNLANNANAYNPLFWIWFDNYKEIGYQLGSSEAQMWYTPEDVLVHTGYYNSGFLCGITAWDFVYMILSDTLYADYSSTVRTDDINDNPYARYRDENYGLSGNTVDKDNQASLTNMTSFYYFTKWCMDNGYDDTASIIDYDGYQGSLTDNISHRLIYGDIGMHVDFSGNVATVTDIGIYVGYINGYQTFIHCSPCEGSTLSYQAKVCLSYLQSTSGDASYPDGGTVDYNCFVRVDSGSYRVEDGTMSHYTDTDTWTELNDAYERGELSESEYKRKFDDVRYAD